MAAGDKEYTKGNAYNNGLTTAWNMSDQALAAARYSAENEDAKYHRDRKYPEYVTGARAIIKVNRKKVAAALNVSWTVSIEHTDIRTIDSQMPWEITPGQITVEAQLRRIIHPDTTAPKDHLFTVLQAGLHTPTATIIISDRLGTPLFTAKGNFVSWSGDISAGAIGIESLRFKGIYWRDNTMQYYNPEVESLLQSSAETALKQRAGALNALTAAAGF
jgi:hypothetical protein